MSSGGAGPLVPTFHGFVQNSMDGLVLFEACLSGKLHHVPRRPHDRERNHLIKSGSIFIYEENASGIKRWTDGVAWSPSRILGNFLIYRELEKPFPPGEKKRAMKRKRTSIPGEPYPRRDSNGNEQEPLPTPVTPPSPDPSSEIKTEMAGSDPEKELERALIGSLVDSYGFRHNGLVKKTMSISIDGVSHHMVSYYTVEDVKNNILPRPYNDQRLANVSVRPELYLKQNFRAPVEETEQFAIDSHMHAHPHHMMYGGMPGYGLRPGQYMGAYPGVYAAGTPYASVSGAQWPAQQVSAGAMPYGSHPAYSGQPYGNYYKQPPGSSNDSKQGDQPQSSHEMPYGNTYSPSYSTGAQQAQQSQQQHRSNGSQSTPSMMQSAYHTPVQQNPSSFSSMPSNRQSYGASPTTNGQQQQQSFSPSGAQPYAVRSPQSYGGSNAVPPSPHHSVKSPVSGGGNGSQSGTTSAQPLSASDQQMSYRAASYSVGGTPQSAHPSSAGAAGSDMSGLGISNSASYSSAGGGGGPNSHQQPSGAQAPPPAPPHQTQYGYGHQQHSYRNDLTPSATAQAAGQYSQ